MMLGMYASYWLWVLVGLDPYLSVLVTAPVFFGMGVAIQRIVIEPNRAAAEHNQLLLTLGLALFLENLALVLWQGDFRTASGPLCVGVLLHRRRAGGGAAAHRRRRGGGDRGRAVRLPARYRCWARPSAPSPRSGKAPCSSVSTCAGSARWPSASARACVAVAGAARHALLLHRARRGRVLQHHGLRGGGAGRHGELPGRPRGRPHRGPGRVAGRRLPARARSSSSWCSSSSSSCCSSGRKGCSEARVAVRELAVLAALALLAAPPLLPKYFLEVLISILFFAYLGLGLEPPRAAMRGSSRSATPPSSGSAPTPPRLLLPPPRAVALARHARGRAARHRLRPVRGLSLLPLRAAGPVLLAGDPGLRGDAPRGDGEPRRWSAPRWAS